LFEYVLSNFLKRLTAGVVFDWPENELSFAQSSFEDVSNP